MADVKVNIKGDASDFNKAVDSAKQSVKGFSKEAGSASKTAGTNLTGGLKSAASAAVSFATVMSGLFAFDVLEEAVSFIKTELAEAWNAPKRAAEEAGQAFADALSGITNFNIGDIGKFNIDSQQQVVDLARESEARVKELEEGLKNIEGGKVKQGFRFLEAAGVGLKGIVGSIDDITTTTVSQEQAAINAARTVLEEEKKVLALFQSQVAAIETRNRAAARLGRSGVEQEVSTPKSEKVDFNQLIGPGTLGGDLFLSPGSSQDPFSFGALPDAGAAFFGDNFDESIAEATLNIRNFETAVKAGLIPGIDALQGRSDLLRERLLTMIEQGVSPASAEFQELQGRLNAVETELQSVEASALSNEVAFTVFADVANQALDSIIFKAESLSGALRNVGRRLLSTFLTAGVNVGIGALTGNPLSFGNALAGAVGIPVSAGSAVPDANLSEPTLSSNQLNSFSGVKVAVEAKATRISGGDLLLTIQEAQNTRGTGGISLT